VQGALAIGKAFDVPGVGNVGKQHQPQKDYEALSPGHIATHTSQAISPEPRGNFNEVLIGSVRQKILDLTSKKSPTPHLQGCIGPVKTRTLNELLGTGQVLTYSGGISRDNTAALAASVKKWFFGPLGPGKIPKVSTLEAEFYRQRYDSKNSSEKVLFCLTFGPPKP
jgi:hypothetical protein